MPVDRCVCHNIPFTELKRLVDAGTTSLDQLAAAPKCCTGCGMCDPYVRLLIATGQTSFPVLPQHEIDRILKAAGNQ